MIVTLMVAAAVALLVWPDKPMSNPFTATTPSKPAAVTYIEAVTALQSVCKRLSDTQKLDAEQQKAIDAIMLALVKGCDK